MSESAGATNAYDCKCGRVMVFYLLENGTTPAFMTCDQCGKHATSRWYRNVEGLKPEYEWYKPTRSQYKRLNPHMKEHVDLGGLLYRPIATSTLGESPNE